MSFADDRHGIGHGHPVVYDQRADAFVPLFGRGACYFKKERHGGRAG